MEAASLLNSSVFLDCLDLQQGGRKLFRNICNSGHDIVSQRAWIFTSTVFWSFFWLQRSRISSSNFYL